MELLIPAINQAALDSDSVSSPRLFLPATTVLLQLNNRSINNAYFY